MGRTRSVSPAKHIVSVRINDEEMKLLHELSLDLGINISNLLRKGLDQVLGGGKNSSTAA